MILQGSLLIIQTFGRYIAGNGVGCYTSFLISRFLRQYNISIVHNIFIDLGLDILPFFFIIQSLARRAYDSIGDNRPDKARTEMSVLYPAFCFAGKQALFLIYLAEETVLPQQGWGRDCHCDGFRIFPVSTIPDSLFETRNLSYL